MANVAHIRIITMPCSQVNKRGTAVQRVLVNVNRVYR